VGFIFVMSFFYNIGKSVVDSIPVVLRKVGTVLLFFVLVGALLGFWLASSGLSFLWVLALLIVMVVMWRDLDEGVLALVLYLILLFTFPTIL
jgi:hypothetical protein